MKKFLAILLALVMCMTLLPLAALAEGEVKYTVAGTKELCGSEWTPGDAKNVMTKNGDLYEKTFKDVPAGTHSFKVTNGTWDQSWGKDGGNENIDIQLSAVSDVKITFNPETKEIKVLSDKLSETPKFELEKVTAVGTSAENDGYLNGENWKDSSTANVMTNNNGVYSITYTNVKSGDRELKFVLNGSWNNKAIGGGTIETGAQVDVDCGKTTGNMKFHVEKDGSTVKLELDLTGLDYENGTGAKLTITVTEPETTTPDDKNETAAPDNKDDTTTPDNKEDTKPAPDTDKKEDVKTVTIYVQAPAAWTEVYLYTWKDGSNGDPAWPGAKMTASKTHKGWYEVNVPADVQNAIVNNGSGKPQTVNIKLVSGSSYIVVSEAGQDGKFAAKLTNAPTGDTTDLVALGAAMLLAATGIVATVAGKKKFF